MSYYQDDQERLRKRREALAAGRRPTLTRPGTNRNTIDPYKHNNYLNAGTTKPVQGAEESGEITGSLFGKAKDVIGSAPSTKKDHLGNKPGFDFGDIADLGKMALNWAAPLGTKSFVKGALDPATTAKEGSGLLGLNAKAGANFRAGTGDLVEGTGNIMRWTGDKMDNQTLQKAGKATTSFADKHLIEDYENPYSQEFTWKSMLDPEWYATSVSRSMPFMLSMIVPGAAGFSVGAKAGTMIGNATKLGNFGKSVIRATAGGIGGAAATAPFESAFEAANVYKEALTRGMSEEEADQAADSVFKNNLALLGISSVPELAAVFSPFKGAGSGLKGAAMNAGKVGASAFAEGAQEVGQEFFSADALGDVNGFGEYMKTGDWKEPFAAGAVMGGGMNAFSKLGESDPITMIKNRIKERMSDSMKAQTDKVQEEMRAAGADQETIDEAVFETIAESEEGQAHINEVTQEIVTKLSEQSDDDISVDGVKAEEEEAAEPDDELMDVDEFNPGDTVFVKGMSGQFEVVDNSDPSMLVLKNKYGNELKVGRQAVEKNNTRKDLANAMESAVMDTAKEQLETLPENAQEPAGEEIEPVMEEVVEEPQLTPQEQLREEVTQVVNEVVGVQEQTEQPKAGRPPLDGMKILRGETQVSDMTTEQKYEALDFLKEAAANPDYEAYKQDIIEDLKTMGSAIDGDIKGKQEAQEEMETAEMPGYVSGFDIKDFTKGETVFYRNPTTGALVETKVKAAKGKQLHVDGFMFHGDQIQKKVFKKDESYVAPEEDVMDEFEDYGDGEETLDDIRADLMEEHQEKNEAVEEPKNEVSNVKRPVEGKNEVTVTSKNELINSIDSAAEEARKNKKFVAFENLHKPEIRALAVEFKQKFPDFYAAEIYKRNSEGQNVLSAIKFYPPEMWAGEPKWKEERNWKLQANPGQGRIIISKGETELVLEISRSGKEDKDFTDEELFADDSYANYPRKGNAWRWKGNRRNTFDTIVTPTLEGLPIGVVFGQELEMDVFGIKLGELRKWFAGEEYQRPKPVRKKLEDLPENYQPTHYTEDGTKVAIIEIRMEGSVAKVQDEKGYVEKVPVDSLQPINPLLGDGGNQAEILSQFERNDYATIELDGETQLVRLLNDNFTINVRLLRLTNEGRAASSKPIILDITDPSILTMKKAEKPNRKSQNESGDGEEEPVSLIDTPKNEAVEKYEAQKERINDILAENEEVVKKDFEEFRKRDTATDYMYASDKDSTTLTFTSPAPTEAAQALEKLGFKPSQQMPGVMKASKKITKETIEKAIRKHLNKVKEERMKAREEANKPEFNFKEGDKVSWNNAIGEVTKTMDTKAWVNFKDGIRKLLDFKEIELMPENTELTNFSKEQPKKEPEPVVEEAPKEKEATYLNLDSGDAVWNTETKEVGEVRFPAYEGDEFISVRTKLGYINKVEYWSVKSIEPYNDQDKNQAEEPAAAPAEEPTGAPSELTIGGYPASIEEDKHTKTGEPIWKIKINAEVPKDEYGKWAGKHIKPFKGKFYNARSPIKELRGYFVFQKYPEGIFDNAETKAAEESGAPSQETTGKPKQNFAEIISNEYEEALNTHIQYLEDFKGKGVEQGGVIKNQEGEVQGRYGRISRNPQWYQEFYSQHGRKPNKGEYRQLAEEHLINGFSDEFGSIEPWYSETVERMEDDVYSLSNLYKADQLESTHTQWQDALKEMHAAQKAEKELVEKKKAELSKPKEQPKPKPKAGSLPDWNEYLNKHHMGQGYKNPAEYTVEEVFDMVDNWSDAYLGQSDEKHRTAYYKYAEKVYNALNKALPGGGMIPDEIASQKAKDFLEGAAQPEPKLPDLNNPEYNPVPDIMDEVMNDEPAAQEAPAKSYNDLVLEFASKLANKKVFIGTVESKTTTGENEYSPKEIIEIFSSQVRADVSAQMMDYLNEPNFDSDAWNKLTGEVGIRQIINAAIMNVQEGETNAPTTDTVRTDGKKTLAGTQAENVPGTASERNPGSEAGGSAGNSEDTDRGTDGERDESVRSTGTSAAGNNSPASRGNKGRPALPGLENYRLSKEDISGIKGKKTTAEKNLEIIKLAKQIQEENRPATEEEKKKLVQFVGWGGLKPALEYEWSVKPEWKPFLAELKKVLTEEELDSARRSRLFAHYTAVDVIEGMYDGLQHLGFDGGRILEPAAGIGHFIGMLPDNLANKSRVTAVEIEPMTAQIGRLLYPKSDFRQMGFEKTKIANDFFDVAIGNVPFNEEGVFDKDYKPALTNSLHNYFFVKSLDKVREGGLVAFITSSYTMDSKSKTYRKYLASKAEFIGAIRLPNNAFKDNAGTEVTTDIIILKKLPEGQQGSQDWVDTVEEDFDTGELNWQGNPHMAQVHVNKYFTKNPGMVIGEMKTSKAMYGGYQTAAVAKEGIDIKKEIAKRFKKMPKGVYEKAKQNVLSPDEIMQLTIPAPSEVKEGAFHFQDNRLYVKDDGNLVPSTLTGTKLERVKGLIKVRDAVRKLFYSELHEPSKSDAARKELNKTYDAFVKKHGAINSKANVEVFQEDPDFYVMSNIEDYDKDTGKATKAEIFSKSTIARYEPAKTADNAREAMAISLNEVGSINLARIKELTGLSEMAIMDELEGLIFVDPMNHKIVSREEYLSGNVRLKLEQAETAAATDNQFNKNVDALKEVVPVDIPADGITAPLGSPWIPAEYVREFVGKHLMSMGNYVYRELKANYSPVTAEWKIGVDNKPKAINSDGSFQARWGHEAKYNTDIIEAALNNTDIKVTYKIEDENGREKTRTDAKKTAAVKEKVARIKDEWVKWLWTDENRKADLVRLYNDTFNSYVLREYDGSHLTFPGMNPEIAKKFRPYQKDAVYRATQGGNTLFAHAVGAGKTFEMIASMMELKRLGLVKKPMWVVPNHLVQQSAREFNALYPSANVLVPSKKDMNEKNRKNYLAKIATRNFDVIIVPHSTFGKITVSPDNVRRFMTEQIRQLEEAIEMEVAAGERSDKRLAKTMENAKIRLENKMESLVAKLEKDTKTASFEELGIDAIVVDEAHEFKNLMFATRRNNVGGLGDPEGSGKAFDLFMKVRYLNELNDGRGIIFATGTPISNSLAEMYHMMRYLAHGKLEELNINNFDAWANLFADIQNVLEMAPEGKGYRLKNKVKGIFNAPELITMFREFADVMTTEELLEAKLIKHPKTVREIVEIESNPTLEEKVQELSDRMELVRARQVDNHEDNPLKITNEGRYAALDVRMSDPSNPDYPNSKINAAKVKILDVWKRTKKEKGTQLVFIDLSVPGKETEEIDDSKFSAYTDLRNKLIRSGIPKNEIAFIQEAKNDAQKQELFDKVNSGEIRILIGSSQTMGAGMNVQKRLKALHHLDVPWRPSDIEQREGRILRPGNTWEEVEIYTYVQKGSFDAFMWQLIEAKARIINRVMSGDLDSRTIEDDSDVVLSAAQLKAIASGDERIFEYETLKVDVQKMEIEREEHVREKAYNQKRLHDLTQAINMDGFTRIEVLENAIQNYTKDQQKVQDLTGDKFKVKIGEQTITKRTDAGKFLFAAIEKTKDRPNRSHKVGEFSGFDIQYMKLKDERTFTDVEELWLMGEDRRYSIKLGDEAGTIRSMEARLPAISRMLEENQGELERLNKEIQTLKSLADATFDKEADLQEKTKRRDELAKALSIEENQEEIIVLEEEEEETKPKRSSSTKSFVVGTDTIAHNMTPKTAKDISDKLANVMNTVLRTGNVKGAAATYTPHRKTGNIKDKYLHNIRIAAHELGHHFEEYGFNGDADELMEVAKKYYPAFDKLKNRADKLSEGKAEIFTLYVLNPESARTLAPITVEELENVVAGNKALEKAFKEIRELVEKDKNKAVFEKGLGSIALPSDDKKGKTIGDEYYVDSVPDSAAGKERIKYEIGGRVKRFLTKYADFKIPVGDMQKARTNQDGKDLVKMLAVTGNSEIMARKAFEGWATDHRGRYIIHYRNRNELPDYLMDTYDELNALNPINAKADTPLIERYKQFFQEHKDKERAILEAISSRSLQEISEDGMYLIQSKIKGHNATDALKEEAERIKKEHKENPEFAYFASIIQAYRAAERYSRKDKEGNQKFTEVFMSQETALNIIEATRANFPGLEPLIREYTDNLSNIILTKLVAAGVTTEEARERIEEGSGFYIPTYYAFKNPSLAAEARERKTAGQPIKGFQGKQAEVIDFLRSSIYKLMEVEQSVEFKRVLDEVESSLREEGMGKFGEILPQNRIPKSVQGANIAKQVTEQLQQILGDDAVTIDQIEESIVNNVYTVFFPTDMLKDKAPILMNWHDNKRVYMRLAPDLYNSIRSMQPIHLNAALRVLSRFSGFTRHLAILNPRYFMNVISRDLFSTQIQRNVAQNTIKGFLKGAALAWGKDERLVDQYMNSGSFVSAQENILNSFKRGSVVEGLIDTKAKNWKRTKKNRLVRIINPSELLQWQEQVNRYGVWEAKARELAAEYGVDAKKIFDGREPLSDDEFEKVEKILLEVGYEASEVTTNFRGHGTSESFRKVSAPITFLHGTIQGLYREAREFKQNPKRVFGRISMGVLPMSILSWALLQAFDEDGDDITSEMKDKYWIIPAGGGYIFIAKPFGYALPVSHMERFLDHLVGRELLGKEEARTWYEDFWNPAKHNLLLPFLPIYGTLALELYANKTWYGGQIEGLGDQQKPKEMRFDTDTSLTARFQADVMYKLTGSAPVSPKQFDYAARGLFGEAGKVTLNTVDNLFGKDTPITKNPIYTDKSKVGSRSVSKFYDSLDKMEDEHKRNGTPYEPAPELKRQREAADYLSLFRKVEDEVKTSDLPAKEKMQYEKKIATAKKDLTRLAAGREPHNRETLMEIVSLADRLKEIEKQRKKAQR